MIRLGSLRVVTSKELEDLTMPWYHDFSPLGFSTPQRGGIFGPNQSAKQRVIFGLIDQALGICEKTGAPKTVLELFCADGFYAVYAAQRGATAVAGIDLDEKELRKARLISKHLNVRRARFLREDVLTSRRTASVGICVGGLYHLTDPQVLLSRLRDLISTALVVQTVFHLGRRQEAAYFESPAPGWTWGCRFSVPMVQRMLQRAGWEVVSETTNELPGNDRPEDRGSYYALCLPANASRKP